MRTITKKKYNEVVELLKRWNDVAVPADVWTSPCGDYTLPLDTQEFLKRLEEREVG